MKPSQYISKGWCQGKSSVDSSGRFCLPDDSIAARWCLVGALTAAYPDRNRERVAAVDKLIAKLDTLQFARWNDEPKRTQAEVVALLQSIGE